MALVKGGPMTKEQFDRAKKSLRRTQKNIKDRLEQDKPVKRKEADHFLHRVNKLKEKM